MLSPEADSQFLSGESVLFRWSRTEAAEHFDFHIFNVTNSDITQYSYQQLKSVNVCVGETCSISLSVRLPESDKHAWRVRAGNIAGKSDWTRTLFSIMPVIDSAKAQ